MQEVLLEGGALEIRGALDIDRTATGISLRRLPAWTRPQLSDPFMEAMVTMASGMRVRFRTNSARVELDLATTQITFEGKDHVDPAFELRIDGVFVSHANAHGGTQIVVERGGVGNISVIPGTATTVVFDGLAATEKDCEIWFPSDASVELRAVKIDATATLAAYSIRQPRWVHYGSSISHCMDVDRPSDVWPTIAAGIAGVDVQNLGLAGQCHLDPFMGRVIGDQDAEFISLKLGINLVNAASMTQRTFGPAVHGLLDTIRERRADTPILVVSPIFCPLAEKHVGPTVPRGLDVFEVLDLPIEIRALGLTLQHIRTTLASIVERRRGAGDNNLHYLDGLELFGEADQADLYDRLHPNPAGYRRIGERFAAAAFGGEGPFSQRVSQRV